MLICCRLFPLAQKPMVLGTSHNCLQNRSDNDIKQTMVPHVHRCGSSYIDANSTKQNTMLPNLTLPRVPNVLPKRDRNSETTMGSTCAIVAPSTDGACNILTAPVHNAHLMVQTRRHPPWGPPCRSPALPAFRCPTERGGGVAAAQMSYHFWERARCSKRCAPPVVRHRCVRRVFTTCIRPGRVHRSWNQPPYRLPQLALALQGLAPVLRCLSVA